VSTYWFNWVQRDSTQETLISENRVFIQTHSHGMFLWILMPVSATLASQELLRPSSKSRSCAFEVRRLVSQWERLICTPGDPHSHLQCKSSFTVHQPIPWSSGEGARSQAAAASTSGSQDGLRQCGLRWVRRQARLWVLAWVYIPCGDLTTSVICTVTLGLACLYISLSHSSWLLSPNTH
jgi:hypothetical protein